MRKKIIRLRAPRAGDMGRVVQLHGELYAKEFGYDATFEALGAGIAAGFVRNLDAQRERCWIAAMDGEVVGSVFLVKQSTSGREFQTEIKRETFQLRQAAGG